MMTAIPGTPFDVGEPVYGGYAVGVIDTTKSNIDAEDYYQTGEAYLVVVSDFAFTGIAFSTGVLSDPPVYPQLFTRWNGLQAQRDCRAASSTFFPAFNACADAEFHPRDGASEWYLPALDEISLLYWYLKPTTQLNNTTVYSNDFPLNHPAGENISSDPQKSPYTEGDPTQTDLVEFQSGGSLAFFSSTGSQAWTATTFNQSSFGDEDWQQAQQSFRNGAIISQNPAGTNSSFYVRPIRRIALSDIPANPLMFNTIVHTPGWPTETFSTTSSEVTKVDFSPDNSTLAGSHVSNNFISAITTNPDWSYISGLSNVDGNQGRGVSFSPNGLWLANAHAWAPCITVFNTNDWSTVAGVPGRGGSDAGLSTHFSPDSSYLAYTYSVSPFLTVVDTSDWTTVSLSATVSGQTAFNKTAFSPDGQYLAFTSGVSPYLYVIETTTWTLVAGTPAMPGNALGLGWSPDSRYLGVGHTTGVSVVDTTDWSSFIPTGSTRSDDIAFSRDGIYMATAVSEGTNGLNVFEVDGWTKIVNSLPFDLPSGRSGRTVEFSHSVEGEHAYLAVGHQDTPSDFGLGGFLTVLKAPYPQVLVQTPTGFTVVPSASDLLASWTSEETEFIQQRERWDKSTAPPT